MRHRYKTSGLVPSLLIAELSTCPYHGATYGAPKLPNFKLTHNKFSFKSFEWFQRLACTNIVTRDFYLLRLLDS